MLFGGKLPLNVSQIALKFTFFHIYNSTLLSRQSNLYFPGQNTHLRIKNRVKQFFYVQITYDDNIHNYRRLLRRRSLTFLLSLNRFCWSFISLANALKKQLLNLLNILEIFSNSTSVLS